MLIAENHIGRITVSDGCIAEIVRRAVCDCFGVTDVCNVSAFRRAVSTITRGRLFGRKGVAVRTSDSGGLVIDLHIKVSYGTNISASVESIVHKIVFTLENTVDVSVRKINVFVDDMN